MNPSTADTARIVISLPAALILGTVILTVIGVLKVLEIRRRRALGRKVAAKKAAIAEKRAATSIQRRVRAETALVDPGFGAEIGPLNALPLTMYTAPTRREINETALAVLEHLQAQGYTEASMRIGRLRVGDKSFARNITTVVKPITELRTQIQRNQRSLDKKAAQDKTAAREDRAAARDQQS